MKKLHILYVLGLILSIMSQKHMPYLTQFMPQKYYGMSLTILGILTYLFLLFISGLEELFKNTFLRRIHHLCILILVSFTLAQLIPAAFTNGPIPIIYIELWILNILIGFIRFDSL